MGARWLSDLAGTLVSAFRINKAQIDASGLSTAQTYTLPDKSGTVAMTSDISGSSGLTYQQVFSAVSLSK